MAILQWIIENVKLRIVEFSIIEVNSVAESCNIHRVKIELLIRLFLLKSFRVAPMHIQIPKNCIKKIFFWIFSFQMDII